MVLESRIVNSHAQLNGKVVRTRTMRRIRECKNCGHMWRTLEYMEPVGKEANRVGGR